jgi:hypothetical protein
LGFQVAQHLRVALFIEFEEDLYLLKAAVDGLPVVELGKEGVSLLEDLGGFLPVVVEAGFAQLSFKNRRTIFPAGKVKDASAGRKCGRVLPDSCPRVPCSFSWFSLFLLGFNRVFFRMLQNLPYMTGTCKVFSFLSLPSGAC